MGSGVSTGNELGRRPSPPESGDANVRREGKRIVPQSAKQALRTEPGVAPPLRRRARGARNRFVVFFNFLLTLVILVLLAIGGVLYYGKIRFDEAGPLEETTAFMVRQGYGIGQIAASLENQNIITDSRIFREGVRFYGKERSLKAGEYEFKAGASMRDVMETLVSGRSILHPMTIVEGTTVTQALDKIRQSDVLTGDMPETLPDEGMLVADTQKFTRGTSRSDIVRRMEDQQKALIDKIWDKRDPDLPLKDKNEFVTLASIVEKETGVPEERPMVAGVFLNRLKKGMRLQSDPTIIYGIFGGDGKPADRPIYQSDLDKVTPYNTYTNDGLPPGPIAIPGKASLEAVAHPADTDALYFVADGTGGHVFSASLKEHNANVKRWRKIRAEQEAGQKNQGEEPAAKDGN